jgi:peptidoglycan/xylan/chitin deacetylase (PgdA/CDA1 family)
MAKPILLNFDLEEFDISTEYGINYSKEDQFKFSLNGAEKAFKIISEENVPATFFVTGSFASKYPEFVKKLSEKHEIASHNINHQTEKYFGSDVMRSKKLIEEIIGGKIYGFRMPRAKKVDYISLSKLGFRYDSSVSPTYLPGRYNNSFKSRRLSIKKRIYEVPISVPPIIRVPYWNIYRIFGLPYLKLLTKICYATPGFVNLYFHPWEFNNLNKFNFPFYINKNNPGGDTGVVLRAYLRWCKKNNYNFKTFSEFLGI